MDDVKKIVWIVQFKFGIVELVNVNVIKFFWVLLEICFVIMEFFVGFEFMSVGDVEIWIGILCNFVNILKVDSVVFLEIIDVVVVIEGVVSEYEVEFVGMVVVWEVYGIWCVVLGVLFNEVCSVIIQLMVVQFVMIVFCVDIVLVLIVLVLVIVVVVGGLLVFVLFFVIIKLIWVLIVVMGQFVVGNVDVIVLFMDQCDEIGDMSCIVQVFQENVCECLRLESEVEY